MDNEHDECCDDWAENVSVIDTLMRMAHSYTALPVYEGPRFKYCPFCGQERDQVSSS